MEKKKIINIAHRGARSFAPENTLAAAQKGFEIGADLWELDVALTADDEIVVIHDDTLERTSNIRSVYPERSSYKIESFTLEELRKLDFGLWFLQCDPFGQIAAGNVSRRKQEEFVNVPIPTLADALTFTRDLQWRVNVEIKDLKGKPGDRYIAEKVVDMIARMGMEDSVIISSFNHPYIQRVRTASPRISTAALVEFPDPDPIDLLKRLDAQAYNPNLDTLKYDQIQAVTSGGYSIFVWTVNEPEVMKELIDAGVTGIFTDFPQDLIKLGQA